MISLSLARKLKDAGLTWRADIHDFFAIPDRGMDERVFVISNLQSNLDIFRGWPVVTFHGAAEWALDYILTSEVVWLPTEQQLREAIIIQLQVWDSSEFSLVYQDGIYRFSFQLQEEWHYFDDQNGEDAYGNALLFLIQKFEERPEN